MASGGAQPCFHCISTYRSLYFVCRLIANNNNNTLKENTEMDHLADDLS